MITVQARKVATLVDLCRREGKFFTVGFYKRGDGSYREINCRGRVCKGLHGGSLPYDPKEHSLAMLYDVKDHIYKAIPIDGIVLIRAHGVEYNVNG